MGKVTLEFAGCSSSGLAAGETVLSVALPCPALQTTNEAKTHPSTHHPARAGSHGPGEESWPGSRLQLSLGRLPSPLEVWDQLPALGIKTPKGPHSTSYWSGCCQPLSGTEQAVLLPPRSFPCFIPFSSSLCPGDEVQSPSKTHQACPLPPSLSQLPPAHQPYPQPPLLGLAEEGWLPHT